MVYVIYRFVKHVTRGSQIHQQFYVALHRSEDTINKNYPVGKFEYLDDYLPDTVRRISTSTTGLAVLRVRWFTKKQRTQIKLKSISKNILNAMDHKGDTISYSSCAIIKFKKNMYKKCTCSMENVIFGRILKKFGSKRSLNIASHQFFKNDWIFINHGLFFQGKYFFKFYSF